MTEEFGGIDNERGIERDGSDNAGLIGGEDSAALIGQTAIAVAQPAPGESLSIDAAAGQRYVIEFSPDAAQVRVRGNDLILEFADGGSITFANLGLVVDAADEPVFEVAGQPISSAVIFALGEGTLETAAAPTVVGTGETRYDDDTGELIDLIDPQGVIPPTELEFRLIDLEPTEVLAGLTPPVDFDVSETANFVNNLDDVGISFAPALGDPFALVGAAFVLDDNNGRVLEIAIDGSTSVLVQTIEILAATGESSVDFEDRGVTIDPAGNIYFTDARSDTVLVKPADGSPVRIVATEADLDDAVPGSADPHSLVFAPDGFLYVAEENSDSILKVDPATGAVTLLASDSDFESLSGISNVDLEGGLIVSADGTKIYAASDGSPDAIFEIDIASGDVSVLATDSRWGDLDVFMVLAPNGDIIVADDSSDTIYRVTPAGVVTEFLTEDELEATVGQDVDLEGGIWFDANGNFYVAEENTSTVYRWTGTNPATGAIDPASGTAFATDASIAGATGENPDFEGGALFQALSGTTGGFLYEFQVGESEILADNIHGTDAEDGVTTQFTITTLPTIGLGDQVGVLLIDRGDDNVIDEIFGEGFTPLPAGGINVQTGDSVFYFLPEGATVPNPDFVPGLTFDTVSGSDLNLSDDDTESVALSFNFNFQGVDYSDITVSSNGFIWLGGTSFGSDCCDGDVSEFLGDPPRIAPAWFDLDPGDSGTVTFADLGDRAVITWSGVEEFSESNSNTFQIVLFADGRIAFNYDELSNLDHDGLIGITAGNGAGNPGESGLSAEGSFNTGSEGTVYQFFEDLDGDRFDVSGQSITFTPNGSGGWIVETSQSPDAVPETLRADDQGPVNFNYFTTDSDGLDSLGDGPATVTIDFPDAQPIVVSAQDASVDEDDIDGGEGRFEEGQSISLASIFAFGQEPGSDTLDLGDPPFDPDGQQPTRVFGAISVDFSFDGPGTAAFTGATISALEALELTSSSVTGPSGTDHDAPLSYQILNDGRALIGFVDRVGDGGSGDGVFNEGDVPVFTLELSEANNAGLFFYTFDLIGSLNHPDNAGENTLGIGVPFVVTDFDGDSTAATFEVTVVDDVPTIAFDGGEGPFAFTVDGDSGFDTPDLWQVGLDPDNSFSFPFSGLDGGEGTDFEGLTFGTNGQVLFAYDDDTESFDQRILKIDPRSGDTLAIWTLEAESAFKLHDPGLTVNADGQFFAIGDGTGGFDDTPLGSLYKVNFEPGSKTGGAFSLELVAVQPADLGMELTGLAADPNDPSILYALGRVSSVAGEETAVKLVKITLGDDTALPPTATEFEFLPGATGFISVGDSEHGLSFAPDGTLWGLVENDLANTGGVGSQTVAFQIDPETGASIPDTTVVLPNDQNGFESLAVDQFDPGALKIWEQNLDGGEGTSTSQSATVVFGADGPEVDPAHSSDPSIVTADAAVIAAIKLDIVKIEELDETGNNLEGGNQTVSSLTGGAFSSGLFSRADPSDPDSPALEVFLERPLIVGGPNDGEVDPTKIVGFIGGTGNEPRVIYENDFSTDAAGATLILAGNSPGAEVTGGQLVLTQETNSLQNWIQIDGGAPLSGSFLAEFDLLISSDGDSGRADGVSFQVGNDVATSGGPAEEPRTSGLVLTFDTFDNFDDFGGPDVENEIALWFGGVKFASFVPPAGLHTDTPVPVTVDVLGTLVTVSYNGAVIFDSVDVGGTVPSDSDFFFGARTGGASDFQAIDNVRIEEPGSGEPRVTVFEADVDLHQVFNGEYQAPIEFTLFKPLVHPDADNPDTAANESEYGDGRSLVGPDADSIQFSFNITVTDDDGDSNSIPITVTIDDDGPRVFEDTLAQVDEDGLPARGEGGNEGIPGGPGDVPDPQPAPGGDGNEATFVGFLNASFGADGPGEISFAALDGQAVVDNGGVAVLSNGNPLVYSWDADSHTLTAFAQGTSGEDGTGGSIFITGHDSDEHENYEYDSAGLDYLLFGGAADVTARAGKTVALLHNGPNLDGGTTVAEYISEIQADEGYNVSFFDLANSSWTDVFAAGFDVIMVASIEDYAGDDPTPADDILAQASRDALFGAKEQFADYINAGGGLFIHTDGGFGQTFYDFVPNFGTTINNTIDIAGIFTPTAAGAGIGLTEAIVDSDVTHSFYTGIDTGLFTVFETTEAFTGTDSNNDPVTIEGGQPVAFGARGIGIQDGEFGLTNPVFTVQITDVATGAYEVVLLDQLDHPDGSSEDNIVLNPEYTITDFDGDTQTGTLLIDIDDDSPATTDNKVMGVVEEEQLAGGNEDTTSGVVPDLDEDTSIPNRDDPANPITNFGITTDVATGSLAPLVNFGADGPAEGGGFSFSSNTGGLPALFSNGEPILYDVDGDTLTGFVDRDVPVGELDPDDLPVFTLTLQSNGDYIFTLFEQLDHAAPPAGTAEENILEIDFSSVVVATDFDGDSITLDEGDFTVKAIDDVPVIADGTATVAHDETPGVDADADDTADTLPDAIAALGLTPIGAAQSPAGQLDYSFGADGPGQASLTGANGAPLDSVDSGLTRSSDGASIFLFSDPADPQLVLGKALLSFETAGVDGDATQETISFDREHRLSTGQMVIYSFLGSGVDGLTDDGEFFAIVVDADTIKLALTEADALAGNAINLTPPPIDADALHFLEADGDPVLAVYLDTNGTDAIAADDTLWVAQFQAIEHPIAGDGAEGSHDESVSLADEIFVTVTDFDGDSVTADSAITVEIQDDGPSVGNIAMTNDETAGVQDGTPPTDPDTGAAADPDNDDTGETAPLPAGVLALVTGLTPINTSVKAIDFDFGADGPGGIALDPIDEVEFPGGKPSGLFDTASGDEILLFNGADDTIIGRVGTADGPLAFVSFIGDPDPASADLWFVQYLAIQHDNPLDPDEAGPEGGSASFAGDPDVINFETLDAGTFAETVDDGVGVFEVLSVGGHRILVTGENPDADGAGARNANAAVIFDSADPSRGLFGLGTPNEDFDIDPDPAVFEPGPGIGIGGELGSPFQNDTPLGKTLIIDRDLRNVDADPLLIDDPAVQGNVVNFLTLDFSADGPVTMDSLDVMDLNNGQTMTIRLFGAGDTLLAAYNAPGTEVNGVATVDLGGTAGVVRVLMTINGSAAVDNIVFRPEEERTFQDEFLNLTYTVTDGDLDTVQGTARITIEDDGPTAVNDTALLDTALDEIAFGNVFGNDVPGADDATVEDEPVTLFRYTGEDSEGNPVELSAAAGSDVTTANGGLLFVDPNGDWAYLASSGDGISEAGYVETVSYVIEDGDGDTDSATLQIRVILDPDSVIEASGEILIGTFAEDFLVGDGTDNIISGLGGADLLFGGAGGDTLIGGDGVDQLYGEGGADTFVIEATGVPLSLGDVIADFEDGVDTIGLAGGLSFAELTISDVGGAAVISVTATTEVLVTVESVTSSLLDDTDFTTVIV